IISVFTRPRLFPQGILTTPALWTLLNLVALMLWLTGNIVHVKGNFAGVCANRNEFAVQTILLLSFTLLFVKNKVIKAALFLLGGIMITASLSTQGFLCLLFICFFPAFLKAQLQKKVLII